MLVFSCQFLAKNAKRTVLDMDRFAGAQNKYSTEILCYIEHKGPTYFPLKTLNNSKHNFRVHSQKVFVEVIRSIAHLIS